MEEAAESVVSVNGSVVRSGAHRDRFWDRRLLLERTVRSVRGVMSDILAQHALKMPVRNDQEPVEAFAPNASDPALGVCPRLRRPHRRLDYTDVFGAEDLVELARELAVAVTDEKPCKSDASGDFSTRKLHKQLHTPPRGPTHRLNTYIFCWPSRRKRRPASPDPA